jgi:hypothetical protein
MKKLLYREGDVFSIPLRNGNVSLGVLARSPKSGWSLLGYFFPYQYDAIPLPGDVPRLTPESAIRVMIFSALSLKKGEWEIISRVDKWDEVRELWKMPRFIRRAPIGGIAWLVDYADNDPSKEIAIERCDPNLQDYYPDGACGAGYVEIVMTKLIDPTP